MDSCSRSFLGKRSGNILSLSAKTGRDVCFSAVRRLPSFRMLAEHNGEKTVTHTHTQLKAFVVTHLPIAEAVNDGHEKPLKIEQKTL